MVTLTEVEIFGEHERFNGEQRFQREVGRAGEVNQRTNSGV